jgi:biopolymer transport protein ExbB/TolQ
MFGLAGTLIPLGPGLRAMAEGQPGGLANNLVIAFTTTVIGLAISALSLCIVHVRTRWYESDLALCAALVECKGKLPEVHRA